jgi:hypothetical protein
MTHPTKDEVSRPMPDWLKTTVSIVFSAAALLFLDHEKTSGIEMFLAYGVMRLLMEMRS